MKFSSSRFAVTAVAGLACVAAVPLDQPNESISLTSVTTRNPMFPNVVYSGHVPSRPTPDGHPDPVDYAGVGTRAMLSEELRPVNLHIPPSITGLSGDDYDNRHRLPRATSTTVDEHKGSGRGISHDVIDGNDFSKRQKRPFWDILLPKNRPNGPHAPQPSPLTKLHARQNPSTGDASPLDDTKPSGKEMEDNVNHLEETLRQCAHIRPMGAVTHDDDFACFAHANFDMTQRFKCYARDSVCFHQYMLVREHHAQTCWKEFTPCTRVWADCVRMANLDRHNMQKVHFWEYCNAQTGFVWVGVDLDEWRYADKIKIDNFWHVVPPSASNAFRNTTTPDDDKNKNTGWTEGNEWSEWREWTEAKLPTDTIEQVEEQTLKELAGEPVGGAKTEYEPGPEAEGPTMPGSYEQAY